MKRIKVRDVMTERVVTVREDASLKEAVDLLLTYDVSGLPVVDDTGALVGIVTEGDLLGKEAGVGPKARGLMAAFADWMHGRHVSWSRKLEATTVREIMTTNVETTSPEEDLRFAARRMMRLGLKRLPVVRDAALVGIISRHDVLTILDRPSEDLQSAVEDHLRRYQLISPDHEVEVSVTDGIVHLKGTVRHETDVRLAELLVNDIDGVLGVRNELAFQLPTPYYAPHGA